MAHQDERYERSMQSTTFKRIVNRFHLDCKKVLDIGSGWGEYLVSFGKGSMGITGQDVEVAFCKEKKLKAIVCNAEYIDVHVKESFDVIWANNFLEHILSPHYFLMRARKLVNREGIIIIGVPVVPRIISLMRIRKFSGALADSHISFFTKKSIELTLQSAGYILVESRPFIFKNRWLDSLAAIIAPHMYVVASVNHGFHYSKKKIAEWANFDEYRELLSSSVDKD